MELTASQWATIATSILGSTVISGLVAFVQSRYLAKLQHRLEYDKVVIKKRIESYNYAENFVQAFGHSINIGEGNVIHGTLHSSAHLDVMNGLLFQALRGAIWLNAPTEAKLKEMGGLFATLSMREDLSDSVIVEFAKYNYDKISRLRTELYGMIKNDYGDLYNMKGLRKKKVIQKKALITPYH